MMVVHTPLRLPISWGSIESPLRHLVFCRKVGHTAYESNVRVSFFFKETTT